MPTSICRITAFAAMITHGIVGTLISKDTSSQDRDNEFEVRSLTGAGAEKAAAH